MDTKRHARLFGDGYSAGFWGVLRGKEEDGILDIELPAQAIPIAISLDPNLLFWVTKLYRAVDSLPSCWGGCACLAEKFV